MADQADSMATPEQVLAAGGVSRRRRGTSASGKRRSPSSGARRRAPTPEPPKDVPLDDEEEVAPPVRTKKKSRDKSATRNRRSLSSPGEDRIVQASSGEEGDAVVAKIAIADGKVSATETIITESKRVFKVEKVDPASLLTSPADDSKRDVTPALPDNIVETKAVVEKIQEPLEKFDEEAKDTKKTSKKDKIESGAILEVKERVWRPFLRDVWSEWVTFKRQHKNEYDKILSKRNQCFAELVVMIIYCGLGGLVFRFTEGAFESFYKCGVKRVKRNFIDDLWLSSHNQREEDWKSHARRRLMEFENQLHAAHEAGVHSYSGQRSWSFLNAVLYCLTVVTTIGYGHISPSTTTGRAITIVYAIFGIPLFLILLADFGKLFTRGIKFLWAFVRRLYYTGSCRRVRRTAPVQEVWKGVQLVYDFATFRRPSQIPPGEGAVTEEDEEASVPLQQPQPQPQPQQQQQNQQQPQQQQHDNLQTVLPIDGLEPGTPAPSAFEVDDEFNLPISIAIFILLAYIFVGASVYFVWEEWGFFESFYFVFISMSTIGFGDFVPQHPMYMMASIVYLVFGLALTSMCINVVQIKLSDSFRQASAKLGATIGLRMAEEDGALTPSPVVEITDVQPTITKSLST